MKFLGLLFAVLLTVHTVFADSGVRNEFEVLKTHKPINIEELNKKISNLTAAEFELVIDRLISDLKALPDSSEEVLKMDHSEIEFLIQVVFARGNKDFLTSLKEIHNLASRKLFALDVYNDLWRYQIDHVMARSKKELMTTTRNGHLDLSAQRELQVVNTFLVAANLRIQRYARDSESGLPRASRFTATERDGDINLEEIAENFEVNGGILAPKRKLNLPEFEVKPQVDYSDLTALGYREPQIEYQPIIRPEPSSQPKPSAQIVSFADYKNKKAATSECSLLF